MRPFAQKDVQGNIVAIVDSSGWLMVEYEYDAWGINTIIDGSDMLLATLNPFRYRGYYYDTETGLYFLKTRYYDPEIGRFISIDGIEYLDPETINGLNLYAYCNNNPVMNIDPNGTWGFKGFLKKTGLFFGGLATAILGGVITLVSLPFGFIPGTGVITQMGISVTAYGAFMMGAAFDDGIYADMSRIGWNPFNTDANLVLSSNKVSFYKGVPVIRYNGPNNSSLSAGIIFLDKTYADVKTLNHEWGHNVQLWMLGGMNYFAFIMLPSLTGNLLSLMDNRVGRWLDENYYNLPWERSADFFGKVTGRHKAKTLPIALVYFFALLLI